MGQPTSPDTLTLNQLLGRRLRRIRRMRGFTQAHLGARAGVTFQQIQKYEAAQNKMSAVTIWRLAEALHIEVSYFFQAMPLPAISDQPRHIEGDHHAHLEN